MPALTQNGQQWKPSVFNVRLNQGRNRWIYNSVSTQLVELSGDKHDILDRCLEEIEHSGVYPNGELLQCLIALGLVVPRSEDEYRREREKFLAVRSSTDKYLLTIAPTMSCNLRCTYCFQQNLPKSRAMRPEIQHGVAEFVRRSINGSTLLLVQWFGGEPLLAFDTICSLSGAFKDICADHNVTYAAEVLTNGTLLTPAIIDSLQDLSIRAVQIPVDGNAAAYAERKRVPLKKAEAFYCSLLKQVRTVIDITGSVTIRINVDRDNPEAGKEIVAMFKEDGITDPRIDFRLGFINTSRGILDCIPHDCFSYPEFAEAEQEFRQYLANEGYMVYGKPEPLNYPCMAAVGKAFTIDPQGRIGKCVPAIGSEESVFSRIYPDDMDRTMRETGACPHAAPYAQFDPYEGENCRHCGLLPVCLGSCPKMHEPNGAFACGMKDGLADKLAFYSDFHASCASGRWSVGSKKSADVQPR